MDKGLETLEKFYKEFTEDNPRNATLLARAATEAYILNTEFDGKPKSENAGKNIYDAMFNFVKTLYVPNGNFDDYSEKLRQTVEDSVRENIGIDPGMLENVMKKGIDFTSFYEGLIKACAGNFTKKQDQVSENVLTEESITPDAKKALIERAKKLELRGLEGITEDAISSLKEFRMVARKLAEYKRGG